MKDLSERVAELSRQQQQATSKQDEMENQILLLTDQLESQRVAQGRHGSAELPVVTLQPRDQMASAQEPVGVNRPVVFAGAAQSEAPDRIRPLLRAEGDSLAEAVPQLPQSPPALGEPSRRGPPPRVGASALALGQAQAPEPVVEARTPGVVGRRSRREPLVPIPPSGDNLGVVPMPRLAAGQRRPEGPLAPGLAAPSLAPAPAPPAAALPGVVVASAAGPSVAAGRSAAAAAQAPSLTPVVPRPRQAMDLSAGQGEPAVLYRQAYERVRAGSYDDAERELREFVRRFPRHDYADNAQYWLGETFYARKSYPEAAAAFRAVVERWPSGNKAPDALLKLGFSLLMLGEAQKGKGVLSQVAEHYPRTEAARLAERRLAELKDGP